MSRQPHLLLVHPDPVSARLKLALADLPLQLHCTASVQQAEHRLLTAPVDLLLFNLSHHPEDGLALTRQLRRTSSTLGIMLLCPADLEQVMLQGLEQGADDVLPWPCDPHWLSLRIRTLLRRLPHTAFQDAGRVLRVGQGWLDQQSRMLRQPDGRDIRLSQNEFQLLQVFMQHPGQPLSRDHLMTRLRNREWLPNDRSIDMLVGRLRRKLGDDPASPQLIITVHGRGYLFTQDAGAGGLPPALSDAASRLAWG